MKSLQIGFIAATFIVPLLFWLVLAWMRARRDPISAMRAEQGMRWFFALILIGSTIGALAVKRWEQGLRLDDSLPLQLCDWAAVATLVALLGRGQMAFEVAYCWGLAGTFQGLTSPAIEIDGSPRTWFFLAFHSMLPAAVLWLLLAGRMRPSWSAWRRVFCWSEVYFVAAMIANALCRSNYGFLSHRPPTRTPLDHFPDPWWLYALSINAFALLIFAIMLAPWRLAQRMTR